MHDFHIFKKETQSTKYNVSVIVQTWHHVWFSVLAGSSIDIYFFFNDHSILFFSLIYTLSLSLRLQELGTPNRLVDASMESIIPATTGRRLRSLDTFRGYGALSLIVLGLMRLRWELKNTGENDLAYKLLLCILWSWLSNVICILFLIILK